MSEIRPDIDPKELRNAFGKFMTGITVVTTREKNGTPRGFTANSFTSVSLDPPLVLICVGKSAASCDVFSSAPSFAINILGESQRDISALFATQRPDKFEVAEWSTGLADCPLIRDCLAHFECAHHEQVDAGDHIILIGRIIDFHTNEGRPLGYFGGSYVNAGLDNALVDAIGRQSDMLVGAILEQNGTVLLCDNPDSGEVTIPSVGSQNNAPNLKNLIQKYSTDNHTVALDFVYSVFEDSASSVTSVCYRGSAHGEAPEGTGYYPLDQIPFDRIRSLPVRTMLKRYAIESQSAEFAVYVGDELEGKYKTVK